MTISNSRKTYKSQPVPERIKELWNLYFEMSLDPELEACAEHIRNAALALEQTRRVAFEVAQEASLEGGEILDEANDTSLEEDEPFLSVRNQKFGSVMKH